MYQVHRLLTIFMFIANLLGFARVAMAGEYATLAPMEDLVSEAPKPAAPQGEKQSFESGFVREAIGAMQRISPAAYSYANWRATAVAEKVVSVNSETHTKIVPEYTENGLRFRLLYDEIALQDKIALVKEIAILTGLTSPSSDVSPVSSFFKGTINYKKYTHIHNPHSIAELLINAQEGSPTARARWARVQADVLSDISFKYDFSKEIGVTEDTLNKARELVSSGLEQKMIEAEMHVRNQKKSLEKWKTETKYLDKLETMTEKLDSLILKNDRKGVRQMLEAYLPWAAMEPVEARTWKVWLEAIENPNPEKTTLAFRGIDYETDKIQREKTASGELIGFMSTVLTKNQGSYTRRLRSLTTNREKNGDIGFLIYRDGAKSIRMTDQMFTHARDPVASSFISFTYDPAVAINFIGSNKEKTVNGKTAYVPGGGLLVVKMDSRRMVPNLSSRIQSEIELLAPLIVFPDEVVLYKEGSFMGSRSIRDFTRELRAKTGIDFSSWISGESSEKGEVMSKFRRDGYDFFKKVMESNPKAVSCSKIF